MEEFALAAAEVYAITEAGKSNPLKKSIVEIVRTNATILL